MKDQDIILAAYQDTIKQVYTVFFNSCAAAETPQDQQQAEQLFVTGVTTARKIRDRALAILP
jgi:hypothetical protein